MSNRFARHPVYAILSMFMVRAPLVLHYSVLCSNHFYPYPFLEALFSETLFNSLNAYSSRLKNVALVSKSSNEPWLEAMLLYLGAGHITSLQAKKTVSNLPQLEPTHPLKFVENWRSYANSFDFIVSISGVASAGLGLDHPEPNADLGEMQKFRCLLKVLSRNE